MNRYLTCTVISALTFMCASAIAGAETNPAHRPLRLGYLTDLSGKGAFLGTQSRFGAELAATELADQGMPLQMIFGDHRLDTRTALSEAAKLLELDRVDALLTDFTPTAVAVSPLASRAKVLFIYQAPAESILEDNPYAFRNFLDYAEGCKAIAAFWQKKGVKNVAHLKMNLEFGELCSKGARAVFPDQIVADYNSGDDIRSIVMLWKSRGVEAIFQTAYEIDMLNRLRSYSELEYFPQTGVPEPLMTSLVLKDGGRSTNGTVTFGYGDPSADFVAKVEKKEPGHSRNNIESAAIAYFNVRALVRAIRACPARDLDCQRQKLIETGPDSTLGFKGWKARSAAYDYQLKIWHGGKGDTLNPE